MQAMFNDFHDNSVPPIDSTIASTLLPVRTRIDGERRVDPHRNDDFAIRK